MIDFKKPESTMDNICHYVANGNSLLELCKTWKISYGEIIAWIRKDDHRSRMYTDCLNARSEWAEERILLELRRIGLSDIKSIYSKQGEIMPVHTWPDEVSSIIKSVDYTDDGEIKKVTFWNKEKCLELLGKNIQMFIDRVEHTGKLTLEDLISKSRTEDEDVKTP